MNSRDILAAVRDGRRQRVSELMMRGLTACQITQELESDDQFRNPQDNEPWSVHAIRNDISRIRGRWQQAALLNYDTHIARILAQIRQVRVEAWAQSDHNTVLKTIEQEVKLLGLDKATKSELDWRKEMRKAGVKDPAQEFETLVQQAYERMIAEVDK